VKKCKTKFTEHHDGEEFFLHQVIRNVGSIITDLEEQEVHFLYFFCVCLPFQPTLLIQIQGVYEGIGVMISVQPPEQQVELLDKLMGLPNMSVCCCLSSLSSTMRSYFLGVDSGKT